MMKMKRMTALVTLVIFMFSCFALNVSADTTSEEASVTSTGSVFADVTEDTQYATAIQKLYDERYEIYLSTSDCKVDGNLSPKEEADLISKEFFKWRYWL